jgi:DNA modification methylase
MTATAQIWNEDCITGLAAHVPDGSVHLTVTSPPFEELFAYSGKIEDVGNNGSTIDLRAGRFALNLRFVVEQLFRVTAPGCNVCVHIQQLLAYKIQHGFMGRRDFRGAMIDVFGAGGFTFHGEFVIQKNPQAMANKLNLHCLQFKTAYARNGSNLAPCPNDYVLIFQKPGEHPCPPLPLRHEKRGDDGGWMTPDEWVRDAHGIWTDILEIDVVEGARTAANKEEQEEKHVCPLQLEVIRRCVRLYTNPIRLQPDVTVLDPFMGVGSTAYVCVGGVSPVTKLALEEGPRNVIGFELKESYHRMAVARVQAVLDPPKGAGAKKKRTKPLACAPMAQASERDLFSEAVSA